MAQLTRRFIIGTAVVTVLAALVSAKIGMELYNPDWNHGGDPSKEKHPHNNTNDSFNPRYVMLLYMDIEDQDPAGDLRVKAIRLQFPSVGWNPNEPNPTQVNTWAANEQQVVHWINCLNRPPCSLPAQTQQFRINEGLDNFTFNQPHHFVIYIQNRNIEFNRRYPVWFAQHLSEMENNEHKKAKENWSFFGAKVLDVTSITGNNSKKLVYVKNFFKGWDFFKGGYYKIGGDRHSYSLSINAEMPATDLAGQSPLKLPIIIDPDTGNQGGGDPP